MTLTPAQLDEIATKLMGWTKFMDGVFKRDQDDTEYCGRLSPADAMLVLEAMGKWCGSNEKHHVIVTGTGRGYFCEISKVVPPADPYEYSEPYEQIIVESADTPAGAIFQCAAQLVERM